MGCQFAQLDWGGLLDARANMYIVLVDEMAAKEARAAYELASRPGIRSWCGSGPLHLLIQNGYGVWVCVCARLFFTQT